MSIRERYERIMRPVDAFFEEMANWVIWISIALLILVVAAVSTGLDIAFWLSVLKYLFS